MSSYQFNAADRTILIVDDVPDNLRVLSSTLIEQGYRVRCARDGSTALVAVRTTLPNLILLDINMPDMNGYEVCQQLKASAATSDIPVIFISALDDVLDKVRAFDVGGVDYITKPFQVPEVLVRVKSQLALQAAKQEIYNLNAALEQRIEQRTSQLATTNQELQREVAERKQAEQELQREVAERRQAEQLLQESEEKLESILNSLEEVVWSVSAATGELLYLNPAAQKVYDRPIWQFFERPNLWLEVVHPEDRATVEKAYQTLLEGQKHIEYRILRPDGKVRWLSFRTHIISDKKGIAIRIDGVVDDITQRKQVEQQLIHDALHDALTDLPNRTLFMQQVELALQKAKRCKDYLFAVLFIDLDRFKPINDSLGHAVGDRLLVAIAHLLKQCLRPTDIIARLGGDEFTVLLDGLNDINDATNIAERLQTQLKLPFQLESHTVFSSASIGIVLSSTAYEQAADLLRDADIAMYRAKEQGKARYAIFDQVMYEQTLDRLQLESDLRLALDLQEFCLYYQPIISLVTGKLTGFEALIRWQHPQQGFISPEKFIPLAEDTGLIVSLGEWVLREACHQMHVWQIQFPNLAPLSISVNLAARQIREPNLVDRIARILVETGLSGSSLKLELTESMLMEDITETIDTLLQIGAMNVQLSIDDFGTGYSSLSYLHRFPISTLKIDRSFVSRMTANNENLEVVGVIINLAHALGMNVIAEGVETATQSHQLKALGCEFGQGYFFSKPLNCASVAAILSHKPKWSLLSN